MNAINSAGTLGLTASAPTGGSGGIFLQGGSGIAQAITMNAVTANTMTPLAVTAGVAQVGSAVTAVTGVVGNNAVDNLTAVNNSSVATAVNTNDAMSGNITGNQWKRNRYLQDRQRFEHSGCGDVLYEQHGQRRDQLRQFAGRACLVDICSIVNTWW